MSCENTLYCLSRRKDAEALHNDIVRNKGHLGYVTVKVFGGMYSVKCGDIWHKQHVSYEAAIAYILRKWWSPDRSWAHK